MTIFSQEKHHFSLCSYFHAHPTTLLLKILGGTNAWAVPPTSNFGGDRPPQSPPRSPPLLVKDSKKLSTITFFVLHFRSLSTIAVITQPLTREITTDLVGRLRNLGRVPTY